MKSNLAKLSAPHILDQPAGQPDCRPTEAGHKDFYCWTEPAKQKLAALNETEHTRVKRREQRIQQNWTANKDLNTDRTNNGMGNR